MNLGQISYGGYQWDVTNIKTSNIIDKNATELVMTCIKRNEFFVTKHNHEFFVTKHNPCEFIDNERTVPAIKKVLFNYPATIVLWEDGSKTIVRSSNCEHSFDPEKGLAMAIAKKAFGNKGSYYNIFKKWIIDYQTSVDQEI